MRLFVAVTLDDAARHAVAAVAEECRTRARRLAPRARITWVASERMHVTVRFLGTSTNEQAAAIREVLAPPLPLPVFRCAIAGLGTFPARGRPQVVWAGIEEGSDRLVTLEGEVSRRLALARMTAGTGRYRPHVTIGRIREAAGLRADRWLEGLATIPLAPLTVRTVTLFESRLSPRGPDYVPLLETPLAGGPGGGP